MIFLHENWLCYEWPVVYFDPKATGSPAVVYQSIPSLTILPGDPWGFTALRVRFSPNFPCPGGGGFELDNFFPVFERKMQELLDLFQTDQRQLQKQVSCAVSYQFLYL